jgi:ATP-dependent Zn protease
MPYPAASRIPLTSSVQRLPSGAVLFDLATWVYKGHVPELKRALRITALILLSCLAVIFSLALIFGPNRSTGPSSFSYSSLVANAEAGDVSSATVNPNTGIITGELRSGKSYTVAGPVPPDSTTLAVLAKHGSAVTYTNRSPGFWTSVLPFMVLAVWLAIALAVILWVVFLLRRPRRHMPPVAGT